MRDAPDQDQGGQPAQDALLLGGDRLGGLRQAVARRLGAQIQEALLNYTQVVLTRKHGSSSSMALVPRASANAGDVGITLSVSSPGGGGCFTGHRENVLLLTNV
jgi:hypothetical protein